MNRSDATEFARRRRCAWCKLNKLMVNEESMCEQCQEEFDELSPAFMPMNSKQHRKEKNDVSV